LRNKVARKLWIDEALISYPAVRVTHAHIIYLPLLPQLLPPFAVRISKNRILKGARQSTPTMRYVPNKKQVRERLTSVKAWELPKQKSALAPPHV